MRGVVGVAVVPTDELGCGVVPDEVLAFDSQAPTGGRTHRVDHRVVMGQQLVVVDGAADLDVEMAGEPRIGEHPLEHVDDRLGVLMIGRHAGPDQSERRGQPLEQVDLHPVHTDQLAGGIAGRRPGSDDGDPQRSRFDACAGGGHRYGRRLKRMALEIGGVELLEPLQFARQVLFVEDRVDRALLEAGPAVDARFRIDVEHLGRR